MKRSGDYEQANEATETPEQRYARHTAAIRLIEQQKIEAYNAKQKAAGLAQAGPARAGPAREGPARTGQVQPAVFGSRQAAMPDFSSLGRFLVGGKASRAVSEDADQPAGGTGGQARRAGSRGASGVEKSMFLTDEEESAIQIALKESLRESKAQPSDGGQQRKNTRDAAERRQHVAAQVGRPSSQGKKPSGTSKASEEEYVVKLMRKCIYKKMEEAADMDDSADGICHVFTVPHHNRENYSSFLVFLCNQPLRKNEKDAVNYLYMDFLDLTHEDIRAKHDFIALVCPTSNVSQSNRKASVFDARDREFLSQSGLLSHRYIASINKILQGIGCTIHGDLHISVTEDDIFDYQLHEKNVHLHMRITRILQSTRLMGFHILSNALFRCLMIAAEEDRIRVPPKTLVYWYKAVGKAHELLDLTESDD